MKTYSAALAAAALVVLTSVTACGRGPLPPTPPGGDPSSLTLTGRVVDASMGDEAGVADAVVTVSRDSFSASATTSADGSFAIGGLDARQYMLSVNREGYLEAAQAVQLDSDQSVTCFLDRETGDANPAPDRRGRFVVARRGAQARR